MPTRRIRLVPRTPCITFPTGEDLACQSGTATAALVGSSSTFTNLPGTYTIASDQSLGLARPAGSGWIIYQTTGNNTTLTTNSAEPISPSDVLQVNIPTGYGGGGGNEHQSYSVNSRAWSELFVGWSFLLDSGFTGASSAGYSSGVQKLFHLWGYTDTTPTTMVVPSAFGTGTSFSLQLRCQGLHSTNQIGRAHV